MTGGYAFKFGPVLYDRHKGGALVTLVEAMRECYGVGQARVYRADGTLVVDNAGSSVAPVYVPKRRELHRRKIRSA